MGSGRASAVRVAGEKDHAIPQLRVELSTVMHGDPGVEGTPSSPSRHVPGSSASWEVTPGGRREKKKKKKKKKKKYLNEI